MLHPSPPTPTPKTGPPRTPVPQRPRSAGQSAPPRDAGPGAARRCRRRPSLSRSRSSPLLLVGGRPLWVELNGKLDVGVNQLIGSIPYGLHEYHRTPLHPLTICITHLLAAARRPRHPRHRRHSFPPPRSHSSGPAPSPWPRPPPCAPPGGPPRASSRTGSDGTDSRSSTRASCRWCVWR